MENDETTTNHSFAASPGTVIELHHNMPGRLPARIDFGPYGSLLLWLRREDGAAIRVGTIAPTITWLRAEDLDERWPLHHVKSD